MLISRGRIAARVGQLGHEIARDLGGEPLTVAAVMTGAMIFTADLIRHLPVIMRIHLLGISSYGRAATRSRGPGPLGAIDEDFAGQNVLLVDDVLDSGRTLGAAGRLFRAAGARQVRTCVLLSKPVTRRAADGLARAALTDW